jgi:hypothetical protein
MNVQDVIGLWGCFSVVAFAMLLLRCIDQRRRIKELEARLNLYRVMFGWHEKDYGRVCQHDREWDDCPVCSH